MKPPLRNLLLVILLAAGVNVYANVGGVDVTVKKAGKAVYKGKTDTSGSFNTGALDPGAYNIEFRSPKSMNLKGKKLSIAISGGKDAPRQSHADGSHLQAGVAMSVDVAKPSKLTGQVVQAGPVVAESTKAPDGMEKVKANVKIINGKRHVWVPGRLGSNMGGKWVLEGTEGAAIRTNRRSGDEQALSRIQEQSGNVGFREGPGADWRPGDGR